MSIEFSSIASQEKAEGKRFICNLVQIVQVASERLNRRALTKG